MRIQALVLVFFTFGLEVLAKRRGGGGGFRGGGAGSTVGPGRYTSGPFKRDSLGHLGASYSCSADTSTVDPDAFADDTWKDQVSGCLDMMNSTAWNGVHCQPVHPEDISAPYGVSSYGFYKSNSNNEGAGQECFDVCAPCIQKGIDDGKAVTTHCDYNHGVHGAARQRCGMGFDWGDKDYEAKHGCSVPNLCPTAIKPNGE